jgi:cell wall-associated NlpC family hydrolase
VKGSTYVVLEISDNWAKLAVSETEQGWVSMDYISVEAVLETAVDITEDKPEDQVIVETTEEETEEVTQATEKATEAATQATEAATKATEKTTEKTTQATEKATEATTTTTQAATDKNGVSGSDIVAYAKQFLGNPYVYGGSSLTNGTDCSGFTMSVYAHFGYYINRTSSSQVSNGVAVSLSALQPGDLVFYAPSGTVNHVAIYIGNGQIIHASSPSTGIMISNLNYGSSPCYARRIIQ